MNNRPDPDDDSDNIYPDTTILDPGDNGGSDDAGDVDLEVPADESYGDEN